jgi:hypothetical protein
MGSVDANVISPLPESVTFTDRNCNDGSRRISEDPVHRRRGCDDRLHPSPPPPLSYIVRRSLSPIGAAREVLNISRLLGRRVQRF